MKKDDLLKIEAIQIDGKLYAPTKVRSCAKCVLSSECIKAQRRVVPPKTMPCEVFKPAGHALIRVQ